MEKVVDRAMGIILRPEETWVTIKDEETSVSQMFKEYLAILAIIPAVAGFLGAVFKTGFFNALVWGVLFYALSLGGVWIAAKVLSFLATNLRIEHDDLSVFKLVAYSYTAFFIAGIFFLIPPLNFLSIVGLYGFYLFYLGLSQLLECSKEEKFNFTVISMFAFALILVISFALAGLISGIEVPYLRV